MLYIHIPEKLNGKSTPIAESAVRMWNVMPSHIQDHDIWDGVASFLPQCLSFPVNSIVWWPLLLFWVIPKTVDQKNESSLCWGQSALCHCSTYILIQVWNILPQETYKTCFRNITYSNKILDNLLVDRGTQAQNTHLLFHVIQLVSSILEILCVAISTTSIQVSWDHGQRWSTCFIPRTRLHEVMEDRWLIKVVSSWEVLRQL